MLSERFNRLPEHQDTCSAESSKQAHGAQELLQRLRETRREAEALAVREIAHTKRMQREELQQNAALEGARRAVAQARAAQDEAQALQTALADAQGARHACALRVGEIEAQLAQEAAQHRAQQEDVPSEEDVARAEKEAEAHARWEAEREQLLAQSLSEQHLAAADVARAEAQLADADIRDTDADTATQPKDTDTDTDTQNPQAHPDADARLAEDMLRDARALLERIDAHAALAADAMAQASAQAEDCDARLRTIAEKVAALENDADALRVLRATAHDRARGAEADAGQLRIERSAALARARRRRPARTCCPGRPRPRAPHPRLHRRER